MFSPVKMFIDGYTKKIKIVNKFYVRTSYCKPRIVNLFLSAYTRRDLRMECKRPYARICVDSFGHFGCVRTAYGV